MRILIVSFLLSVGLYAQKPVISPGGIVNAASLSGGNIASPSVTPGAIASIFGQNLATATLTATTLPIPESLGGTSVLVGGVRARVFYVSPTQLNIQMPTATSSSPPSAVIVTTAAGASDPYLLYPGGHFGIFTLDGSGCGPGAILNIAADGSASLNTPSNSVSPGDYLTIYGTGIGSYRIGNFLNGPPDGFAAPSDPAALAVATTGLGGVFDPFPFPQLRMPVSIGYSWAGRSPGFVGLDQVNIRVPTAVREGCAVPLRLIIGGGIGSQPVPISIRRGGGGMRRSTAGSIRRGDLGAHGINWGA